MGPLGVGNISTPTKDFTGLEYEKDTTVVRGCRKILSEKSVLPTSSLCRRNKSSLINCHQSLKPTLEPRTTLCNMGKDRVRSGIVLITGFRK